MESYDDVYRVFDESKTIGQFFGNLDRLIDEAMHDEKRKSVVEEFYSCFMQKGIIDYAFAEGICSVDIKDRMARKYAGNSEKLHSLWIFEQEPHRGRFQNAVEKRNKYYVCNGEEAFWLVLYYYLPQCTTPVKTLNALKEYTKMLRETYPEKSGELIDEESVLGILNYVDQKYNFFDIVHGEYRPVFAIADIAHRHAFGSEDGSVHTFVYLTRKGKATNCSPEAILFHEIGHTLHTRCFHLIPKSREMLLSIMDKTCFPGISDMPEEDQTEVIADMLSIGLMYGSPYEKYDTFDLVAASDKRMFSEIVQKMISLMGELYERGTHYASKN